jgi:hypothetical protein
MVNHIQKEELEAKNTETINFNSNTLPASTTPTYNAAMFSTD